MKASSPKGRRFRQSDGGYPAPDTPFEMPTMTPHITPKTPLGPAQCAAPAGNDATDIVDPGGAE